MIYKWNNFLKPITNESNVITINGSDGYIINPYFIINPFVTNNVLKIKTKDNTIQLAFSSPNEARMALGQLQNQLVTLKNKRPINMDSYIENYMNKVYNTQYLGQLEVKPIGNYISIVIDKGLLFLRGQYVNIFNEYPLIYVDENYVEQSENNYMICLIDSYDKMSGEFNLVVVDSSGSGTYSNWYIHLNTTMKSGGSLLDIEKIYNNEYLGELEIRPIGYYINITIGSGLLFTRGQSIIMFNEFPQFYIDDEYAEDSENNYMLCIIDSYDKTTGEISLVVTDSGGSGTFDRWYIQLSSTIKF